MAFRTHDRVAGLRLAGEVRPLFIIMLQQDIHAKIRGRAIVTGIATHLTGNGCDDIGLRQDFARRFIFCHQGGPFGSSPAWLDHYLKIQ